MMKVVNLLFLIFAVLCLTNAIEVAREDPNAVAQDAEDNTAPAESTGRGENKQSEAEEDLKNGSQSVYCNIERFRNTHYMCRVL